MIAFESPVAAALNHLLGAEPWARERLAPFAGETLELRFPVLPALRFLVAADGRLSLAPAEAQASLALAFGPTVLPALLKGEDHFMRAVEVSGDASFANAVLFLFRNLRWDAEEDLARLIGDAPAHRLAGAARGFAAWHGEALARIAENLLDYAIEEQRLLADRAGFEEFRGAVSQLRDALERIEKRVERLAG
jgi:ubiquinone biosynthesis protein UbiJ